MPFIIFDEAHKVGFKPIDSDHKKIASLANKLYRSVSKNDLSSFSLTFSEFLNALELHFRNEEKLMKENNFPGYYSHKLEHDRFYNQVLSFTKNKPGKKIIIEPAKLERIRNWFFNHIEINDRKCGEFLINKGF